jgi:membrane protein
MTARGAAADEGDAAEVPGPEQGTTPGNDVARDEPPCAAPEVGDAARGRAAAVAARYEQTRRRLERTTVGQATRRAIEVDVVHQALVFAALALLLVVPILISVSALVPLGADGGVAAGFAHRFGLTDEATQDLQRLFPARTAVQGTATWGGALLSAVCAVSWPLTLQKGYESVWTLPRAGIRELWRPVTWVLTVVSLVAVTALVHAVSPGVGPGAVVVLGVPALLGWSWWTQHFLLGGRIAWRDLLPGAVAITVGLVGLAILAGLLLSTSIVVQHDEYGPIGIVFAMMSWLIALSVVMLGGPLLGATLVNVWRPRHGQAEAARSPGPPDSEVGAG